MSENRAKVIAAAVTARAALDALLMELMEETGEAGPGGVPDAPPASAPLTCQHKNRTEQVRSFGQAEYWICDDCGYEHRR